MEKQVTEILTLVVRHSIAVRKHSTERHMSSHRMGSKGLLVWHIASLVIRCWPKGVGLVTDEK